MATFALLTRLSPEALTRPESITDLNTRVTEKIRRDCPAIKWVGNYAILGPYDYLDIFEAPDIETATKAALIVRSLGHAQTETWALTPWERYEQLASELKK